MKSVFKAVWNIAVLAYPAWWAFYGIPGSIFMAIESARSDAPHLGLARRFPMIDLLFGSPMDLFLTSVNMLGIAIAFTSFCWGVVTRPLRISLIALTAATPIFVIGHGIQMHSVTGRWSYGIDAFQTWLLFCITAWPVVLFGLGYLEIIRRGCSRFLRRRIQTAP